MKSTVYLSFLFAIHTTGVGQTLPSVYYYHTKLADSLLSKKKYEAAAISFSDAFKTIGWKGLPEDRYKAAGAWALSGHPDSAIFNLERLAFKATYFDLTSVVNDPVFVSLKGHRKWTSLLNKIKNNSDSLLALEAKLDKVLIRKLDSLTGEDQKWRQLSKRFRNHSIPKDSITQETISKNMVLTDSLNSFEVRKIFYCYGFPNYDLVGPTGSGNYWLLVQHQDRNVAFQDSVLAAMKVEVERGKSSSGNYAYLLDRVKINTGQQQIYGTQMQLSKDGSSYEPIPVLEPAKLNERRKSVGLNTIEKYVETMNRLYFGTLSGTGQPEK